MNARPGTQRLIALDRQYVWHPFTPMQAWLEKDDPVVIERGEGIYLIDTDGRRYIDGVSSLWCNIHGHHVPELDAAVRRQLDQIAHSTLLGLANVPSILLAEQLVKMAPAGLAKVFYSDNGSTAVEVACKLAYQYRVNAGQGQRSRFIAFRGSYHGDTLGAVSVGGIGAFHAAYRPLCFPVDFVDPPLDAFSGDLAEHALMRGGAPAGPTAEFGNSIVNILQAHPGAHTAIIVEPLVQGAGGMLMHPRGTLRVLRRIADEYGLFLIADEVLTGFGRTGKLFACDHEEVSPDLLCLSKGLTGGYMPLGATLASQQIFDGFYADPREGKTFFHGHTFTGHPLACATALESWNLMQRNGVLEQLPEKTALLAALLEPLRARPNVLQVRQRGLIAAIELVRDVKRRQAFPPSWRVGGALCTAMRAHGVMLRSLADVLVIMPPLVIDAAALRQIVHAVRHALDDLPEICRKKELEFGP